MEKQKVYFMHTNKANVLSLYAHVWFFDMHISFY